MPVYAQQAKIVRPRERLMALAAVVVVQIGASGLRCCTGFTSTSAARREIVEQLDRSPSPNRRRHLSRRPADAEAAGSPPGSRAEGAAGEDRRLAGSEAGACAAFGDSGRRGASRRPLRPAGAAGPARHSVRAREEEPAATAMAMTTAAPTSSRSPARSRPRDYPRDLREAGVGGRVGSSSRSSPMAVSEDAPSPVQAGSRSSTL